MASARQAVYRLTHLAAYRPAWITPCGPLAFLGQHGAPKVEHGSGIMSNLDNLPDTGTFP